MIEKKEKKEKILSHVYFLLISLLVVFTTLSKVEGADWYNSAWNYCKKITIDHTKVPNSDQSNFPVLISRTDTDWKDTGNGGHIRQSDGGDILFTASNGTTKLCHEIEKYEPSTGRLSVWVKVTNLSHTTDTEIYIYYGNADCPNQWDINGTWDEDYKMVQHFQESCAASNCHLDSTSNNNNGTPYSNTTITNLHTDSGKIEGANIFDGYDDYVDCGNNASLNISDVITIGAWVKKSPPIGIAITNCQELQNIKNNLSGDYYLANDIDCSDTVNWNGGEGFEPIGGTYPNSFTGTFDGQGYKIAELYINRPSSNVVGLFRSIYDGSEIKDVGLENVNISGDDYVGALVVWNDSGRVNNCYSTGSVNGESYVGGLIACNSQSPLIPITNCYSLCEVTGKKSYIGGLIGYNCHGMVVNSFAKGNVNVISVLIGNSIGGLIGSNIHSNIIDCYTTGNVNTNGSFQEMGGLVGTNSEASIINRNYSTGNVSGDGDIGGLVGFNKSSSISDSYWDIETSGKDNMCGAQEGAASGCNDSYGKTTAEMKQQPTFVSWDFTNTWSIEEGITYPFFQWEWDRLINKGRDSYSLQTNKAGSILYGYINDNEITASVSSPAQWHYYVITFDATDQKLFVNGDLKNTSDIGGTIGINGDNVTIGGLKTCFDGAIDEVRISNKPRSEDWIKTSYNNQNDPNSFYNVGGETERYSYQTDNHIKNSAEGIYIGNNIYNTDGSNQTKAQNVNNGATAIYHIRIQNDGNIVDTFTVTGTGGDVNWTVTYYDALVFGNNITADVTGSGWFTGALVSGGTRGIRVEVTPGAGAGGGTSREILITSTSQGDGNADAVKATTTVSSEYQTDNHIKNSAEGTYIGNNIYNNDGSNQTKAQNVDNGITAIYHIRIENDGNSSDTFVVTGDSGDTNWTVIYYDALVAGNNITANVTGSGWYSGALVSGGTKEFRVEVTPGAGAGGGTSREILITSTSQGDGNADAVKAVTTVDSINNYCVDNQIKNNGETSYLGNGIYNLNGADQTAEQGVENNQTAIYHIKVENDGTFSDTFTVTGTGGDASWTIVYYDALSGGNNITDSIIGGGWSTPSISSGEAREICVKIIPGGSVSDGLIKEVLINSQSVGDTNKEDVVKAITTCINVAMPYIKIETKADGSGSEVDSQTINSEDSLIVYAVHRDTSGVYVANVEASWGLIEKTRGAVDADLKPALDNKSATFTGHRVGTAKIKAEHTTLRDDSTGMITVVAGNPTHIKIVDNTGREIYTKAIDVGDSFPVYALSKDANENYVEDVAVTWRLIEKVGDIVDSDLVSALNNRSATFKGKGIGKAKIKACHSSLGDDETGNITVRISKTVFHPVYPNPFSPGKDGTVIFQYDLAEDVSSIGIEIYSLSGDFVRKWVGNTEKGRHRIFWDATNRGGRMVSSGMYFIVIKKDGKVISRKRMVIIK